MTNSNNSSAPPRRKATTRHAKLQWLAQHDLDGQWDNNRLRDIYNRMCNAKLYAYCKFEAEPTWRLICDARAFKAKQAQQVVDSLPKFATRQVSTNLGPAENLFMWSCYQHNLHSIAGHGPDAIAALDDYLSNLRSSALKQMSKPTNSQ